MQQLSSVQLLEKHCSGKAKRRLDYAQHCTATMCNAATQRYNDTAAAKARIDGAGHWHSTVTMCDAAIQRYKDTAKV